MTQGKVWWKYAVLRGKWLPVGLDGRWYELSDLSPELGNVPNAVSFGPTHEWEQREDGEVAVVYRLETP